MKDARIPVRTAVISAMQDTGSISSLVGQRTYDRAPQDVVFPYASLGPTQSSSFGHVALNGCDVVQQIDVWSRAEGKIEGDTIGEAVVALFEKSAPTIAGWTVHSVRVVDTRSLDDSDGVTSHSIVNLRFRLTPT